MVKTFWNKFPNPKGHQAITIAAPLTFGLVSVPNLIRVEVISERVEGDTTHKVREMTILNTAPWIFRKVMLLQSAGRTQRFTADTRL